VKLRAAVFDYGETLLSEERAWGVWADWIGATRQELFAALGATVAGRHPHVHALQLLRPGFDLRSELARRLEAGVARHEELYDVYPDATPALSRLRAAGLRVGIAGNQPAGAAAAVANLVAPGDFVATSAAWGVSKPDPAFFARLVSELGLAPAEIAYIGDRVDNDVVPAASSGLVAIHLRRGPWGVIQATWPEATRAAASAGSQDEAVDAVLART
jgi:HAD superfamily hydrolase (TIGR01549 family)